MANNASRHLDQLSDASLESMGKLTVERRLKAILNGRPAASLEELQKSITAEMARRKSNGEK